MTTNELASMRPRPDAAENLYQAREVSRIGLSFNEAAARCRGKLGQQARSSGGSAGFNEAAARCRGKHAVAAMASDSGLASMRPRPDAAENAQRQPGHWPASRPWFQ